MMQTKRIHRVLCLLFLNFFFINCAKHRNPFDPNNEQTKGKPFNLQAEPYFGSINLHWDNLVLEDGGPMNIDHYQIYRGTSGGQMLKLRATREISYNDTSVISTTEYKYKVSALRGDKESDLSFEEKAQGFWYPKKSSKIQNSFSFDNPFDMAICSCCNRRYVVCQGSNEVLIINKYDQIINEIPVGKMPSGIDIWHSETTGNDTILVCNKGDKSLSVIAQTSLNSFQVSTLSLNEGRPSSIQISKALGKAFVSFEDRDWIKAINLNDFVIGNSLSVGCSLNRLCLNETGEVMLGTAQNGDVVVVIDPYNYLIKNSVAVENKPFDIAFVPNHSVAYIACQYPLGYTGEIKICAIDYNAGTRLSQREIILPSEANWESHPTSATIISEGIDDGLLFISVWAGKTGEQQTRVFGFHIGPAVKNFVRMEVISKDVPRLIRTIPDSNEKKLYVLNRDGLYFYYE